MARGRRPWTADDPTRRHLTAHTEHESEANALNENSIPDPRNDFMRALSVAERLTAESPIQRYDTVTAKNGEVRVMLHHSPENVAEWAALHGLALTLDTNHCDDARPFIEASGQVDGVPVVVWALGSAAERERYAACLPKSVGAFLPMAWRATAGAA